MSKTYKTASVAKTQATKQHGKNWEETHSVVETDEGWEIVVKLPEEAEPDNSNLENLGETVALIGDTGSSQVLADEIDSGDPTDEEIDESNASPAPSMLAGLVGNMLNPEKVPAAPVAAKTPVEKTGKTIEPNRAEQNGLKRPSKGSTCAIIWDTCDRITSEKGSTCTSAELFNALQGYNDCTLRTQYARWRQFNGITGRLPGQTKTAKLPPEFQDAVDTIRVRIADDNTKAIESLEACKTPNDFIAWIAANATAF